MAQRHAALRTKVLGERRGRLSSKAVSAFSVSVPVLSGHGCVGMF